jgi:hypothetical protein
MTYASETYEENQGIPIQYGPVTGGGPPSQYVKAPPAPPVKKEPEKPQQIDALDELTSWLLALAVAAIIIKFGPAVLQAIGSIENLAMLLLPAGMAF